MPFGTPCVRLEGSAYTGSGSPDDWCTPGIPSNSSQPPNTGRRYVEDQAYGSVSILCLWQHMMDVADSHEFRLEGGTLRYQVIQVLKFSSTLAVAYDDIGFAFR